MNDQMNPEYRSYGSYVGRVLAILVAFALLVAAVWFVVRLASEDESTIGEGTRNTVGVQAPSLTDDQAVEDGAVSGATDTPATSPNGTTPNTGGTESTSTNDSEGQTLSTNTTVLPNTGASIAWVIVAPAAAYVLSDRALKRRHR